MNLLETFDLFGVEVQTLPGWETRGHGGIFTPRGILVGSGLELSATISGKPGLGGPLSNFHVSKAGTVTAIARRITHCAGKGSAVVLSEVRRAHPVRRSAATRGLADNTNGDSYFFGLMLEDESETTLSAAERAAAAICAAWRWSPNRVVLAKGWTKRRSDVSSNVDIWTSVRDLLSKHDR